MVRRGPSRDSVETDDSPFGSSLATPVDADVIAVSGAPNSVLRFFGPNSSGEASMIDYFALKKTGRPPFLSSKIGAGSSSSGPVDEKSNYSGSAANPQTPPGYSNPGSTRAEGLTYKKVRTAAVSLSFPVVDLLTEYLQFTQPTYRRTGATSNQ